MKPKYKTTIVVWSRKELDGTEIVDIVDDTVTDLLSEDGNDGFHVISHQFIADPEADPDWEDNVLTEEWEEEEMANE